MEAIKIKHSYNLGDLVSILPGLRQLYRDSGRKIHIFQRLSLGAFYYQGQVDSTLDKEGNSVCMNEQLFMMLRPLLLSQEYISAFDVWEGQEVELDYDKVRDSRVIPMPNGTMYSWSEAMFPQTATDISEPWIEVGYNSVKREYYRDKILVNRTQRYQNPYITYYFLKPFEKQLIFSGTDVEHQAFCSQWNLDIKKLHLDNFYQLAQVIKWCKFFIGNQSFAFHLAESMKTPRILELCNVFPNTFIHGARGYQFYFETAAIYYFQKLNNECNKQND